MEFTLFDDGTSTVNDDVKPDLNFNDIDGEGFDELIVEDDEEEATHYKTSNDGVEDSGEAVEDTNINNELMEQTIEKKVRSRLPLLNIETFYIKSSESGVVEKDELWRFYKEINTMRREMYTFVENEKKRLQYNKKLSQLKHSEKRKRTEEEGSSPIPWKHQRFYRGNKNKNVEYQTSLLKCEKSKIIRNTLNCLLQKMHKFSQIVYPFNHSLDGFNRKLDKISNSADFFLEYRYHLLMKHKRIDNKGGDGGNEFVFEEEEEDVNRSSHRFSDVVDGGDNRDTRDVKESWMHGDDDIYGNDYEDVMLAEFEEELDKPFDGSVYGMGTTDWTKNPSEVEKVDENEEFTEDQMKMFEEMKRAAQQRLKMNLNK